MVHQFEKEGRGEDWVKDGILQIRKESITYGPNYPCKTFQQQQQQQPTEGGIITTKVKS